jgi:suppressor of ftsI
MQRFVSAIVLAALIALGLVHAVLAESSAGAAPDVFPAIPEVRSAGGVARVDLHAVIDPVTGFPTFSWNGRAGVVPTIRVRPGELIDMTVHDDMRPFEGRADDVNVHFHGLTVSPRRPGDDAMTLARPGETLHYRVRIPRDHEPGLFWYHPHAHGETFYAVTNGMSGAIVVEGLERHLPALAAMRERVIVLRDVPTGPGYVDEDMPAGPVRPMPGTAGGPAPLVPLRHDADPCRPETLQPTLNAQDDAHIAIAPGERQLFRVVNASAARYFDLSVDGSVLDLVALDGVPLDAYPGAPAVRRVRHVLLPPAARAEFVVTGPPAPSVLRSACVDTGPAGDANPAVVLAHLVPGAAPPSSPPVSLGVVRPLARNVRSAPLPRPAAYRTIRFTEDARGFYIDGKAFRMDDPPAIVARSGTVEIWTIENLTDESHDFHIHQVHFVVDAIDGVRVTPRAWLDTVDVPRRHRDPGGRVVPGSVRAIVDFRDPVVRGTFVFHCHILDHEDRGMMAKIRVI